MLNLKLYMCICKKRGLINLFNDLMQYIPLYINDDNNNNNITL